MRPRLAPSVFVRSYAGASGRAWLLVPRSGQARRRIDARTRAVLEACDGVRTPVAIALEAGPSLAAGALSAAEVEAILMPLVAEGLVVDEEAPPAAEPRRSGLERRALDADAPLALGLPADVGLGCDGRGGCCALYDRVGVGVDEAERIGACYGDERTPGGLYAASALTRERGDEELRGLAAVDGRCTLLGDDGRCDLHVRLGAEAKPAGCRFFPLRDVACGARLDVALAVECRCVIDFAGGSRAELEALATELLARRRAGGVVEAVAEELRRDRGRAMSRDQYVAWRAAAGARLAATDDVLAWATAEADATPATLARDLAALGAWLRFEANDTAACYSPGDLQRVVFAWGAAAAERLAAARASSPPVAGERLLAEQLLHGHGLLRAPSLAAGLRSLVLRLLLARAGAAVPLPPSLVPIGTSEYLARAHAFGHVFDDD